MTFAPDCERARLLYLDAGTVPAEGQGRTHVEDVRALVVKHPSLLDEMARGTKSCNWGPPMTYAANLGRDAIIAMLRELSSRTFSYQDIYPPQFGGVGIFGTPLDGTTLLHLCVD